MSKIHTFSERKFIGNLLKIFHEPVFSSTREWMEKNVYLSSQQTDDVGLIDCSKTPWMLLFLKYLDDPKKKLIVCRKSSRVAYTTIVNGWAGKGAIQDKVNSAFCFSKKDSLVTYFNDFFKPMILSTPEMSKVVKKWVHLRKLNPKRVQFDNCTVKFLNLGTSSDTKSIYAPRIIIEEPDEVKKDVGKQGNAIDLVQDRKKTTDNYKFLIGGTPTDASFSQVGLLYNQTNQMHFYVFCHYEDCRRDHAITRKEAFDNFVFDFWSDNRIDPIYGAYNPDTVRYLCPHCHRPWTFEQKNKNIIDSLAFNELGWRADYPENPQIGFQFNELLSNFPGCRFDVYAKEYLIAKREYEIEGKEEGMRKIVNTKWGYEYVPLHRGINVDSLKGRRLTSYSEGTVPLEGLILFTTIDKQRGNIALSGLHKGTSRFECETRAWGKNGNSWLVDYKIIEGNTRDASDDVWVKLTEYINSTFPHQLGGGRELPISAVAIDCADDSEVVYKWVAKVTATEDEEGNEKTPDFCSPLFGNAVFAVAGTSQRYGDRYEIYNDPLKMLMENGNQERKSVAERCGVLRYAMGTNKTHDELQRRLDLPMTVKRDRWYHCETNFSNYEKSLLSCVKDSKGQWKQIPSWPKEARDTSRMQLWLSNTPLGYGENYIIINQLTNTQWASLEYQLLYLGYENG